MTTIFSDNNYKNLQTFNKWLVTKMKRKLSTKTQDYTKAAVFYAGKHYKVQIFGLGLLHLDRK